MKNRWLVLCLMFAVSAAPWAASAQSPWSPSKPVRMVVPVMGTTNDVIAREVASRLGQVLGQPVVVENRPGAGGNIGAEFVAKSAADGQTILVGYNGPIAINRALFDKIPFDPLKDFAPITLAVTSPQYLVVSPTLPVNSVSELLAYARKHPGELSYGSIGPGSASHLTMEMFKTAAHIDMVHVPYKGSGAVITDLIAGNVKVAFLVPGNVQQFVKDGRLKVIATSGSQRFGSTPNVPTLQEVGFAGFVATSWVGFLAPAKTPAAVISRYHAEIVRILTSPEVKKKLQGMEFDVVAGSPEQFQEWIRADAARWEKVVRDANVKVE